MKDIRVKTHPNDYYLLTPKSYQVPPACGLPEELQNLYLATHLKNSPIMTSKTGYGGHEHAGGGGQYVGGGDGAAVAAARHGHHGHHGGAHHAGPYAPYPDSSSNTSSCNSSTPSSPGTFAALATSISHA